VQRDWLPNGEGFRLRTIKLRKQISQGLLLPLTDTSLGEGMDVSDSLSIIKWEQPLHAGLAGMAKGNFPSYIPKTDQERVQNIAREVFPDKGVVWEATLKLDGSSCTFYHRDGEVGVCSRNINLKLDQEGNAYVNMFHVLNMGAKLLEMGRNIAIQGELMGPGIQGNREKLPRQQYYCFDVWDIDSQRYLPKGERDPIFEAMGLELVPVLGIGTLGELGCSTLDSMLKYVDRPSMNHKVAEGVVFKAIDVPYSFKCINNRYLLAED
jgi:RNA ligase (TIGR02306 family)